MKSIKILCTLALIVLLSSCSKEDSKEMMDNSMSEISVQKQGTFATVSDYVSQGDFTITKTEMGIKIDLKDNYQADTTLPGFAMYLTNNPNSLEGALVVDAFDDADGVHFSGAFSYELNGVDIDAYKYLVHWCRPYTILVGQAAIDVVE